jgi:hypothetical protein
VGAVKTKAHNNPLKRGKRAVKGQEQVNEIFQFVGSWHGDALVLQEGFEVLLCRLWQWKHTRSLGGGSRKDPGAWASPLPSKMLLGDSDDGLSTPRGRFASVQCRKITFRFFVLIAKTRSGIPLTG